MASSDENAANIGRPRGFLSPADRKWLLMDREEYIEGHSRQYWGQRRDEVYERVHNAILDFSLLWEHWDRGTRWDRRKWWHLRGLDQRPMHSEPIDDRDLERGLRDMAAFALFLCRADTLFRPEDADFAEPSYVDEFLLLVFRRLGREYRRYVRDFELRIEGEDIMWDRIRRQLEEGEEVPVEKLMLALEMDTLDVDAEPMQEAFREQIGESEDEG